MASNKKSFLLYCDIIHTIEELTIEERGNLFTHILEYVNDKNPEPIDRITKIAFEPIKQSLKRDLVKYEDIREKKRLAGLASAESRKQNQQVLTGVESVNPIEHLSTDSTVSDSDSVSVNDSDNKQIKPPAFSFKKSLLNLGVTEQVATDYLKVRNKKKAADTLTAFQAIEKEINKSGKSANECIKIAVEKSWSGFKSDWIKDENKGSDTNGTVPDWVKKK